MNKSVSLRKALSLALITSSLVACDSKVHNIKNTLVVAMATAPSDLDPRRATDAVGMRITGLMFQSLVKLGGELKIIGEAAETWKVQKNHYTFFLHPNLHFSNGEPIRAEDIEFTFDEFRKPTNPFSSAFSMIDKVNVHEKDSRLIVTVVLKKHSSTFLIDLTTLKILPAKYTREAGVNFGRNPIGSGVYEFVSRGVNEIQLRRRADMNQHANIENLVFKVVRDDTTRYLKLRKGEVDLVQTDLPPSKVVEFRNSEQFHIVQRPGLSMAYVLVNHQDKDLSAIQVRQAMHLALDRQALIDYKLEGLGMPATSILIPADPYNNSNLQAPRRDLKKAKELLSQVKLSKKNFILKCSNNSAAVENARVIANQLSELGLDVTVQSYEWGTYYDDIKKGNFELATMRWIGVSDPDIYRLAFHSREFPPGRNRGRYKNGELDKLLDTAAIVENESQRHEIYNKVQKIVYDELIILPLWYDLQVAVMQKNITNYSLPLNGDYSSLLKVIKQ